MAKIDVAVLQESAANLVKIGNSEIKEIFEEAASVIHSIDTDNEKVEEAVKIFTKAEEHYNDSVYPKLKEYGDVISEQLPALQASFSAFDTNKFKEGNSEIGTIESVEPVNFGSLV